ncbi:YrhK-like protein [Tistlia consotensis]|uniref:YrhK-like protein n=1 Tax=Tistlia consotensis USBA 355 TaxID=560819 RepID=A0A1Y6B3L5_9PROT|nr:YrhK family protein [Tistlia consotensis]SME89741.1 YrhK-like protein [Tistlia consotensis USBA 355]SNR26272.1 YrhK-like protein [Tistlia consotensis]
MESVYPVWFLRFVAHLEEQSRVVRETVHDFEWVHTLVGVFGNLTFFVGSIFFFWDSWQNAGVWLFVIGSLAMLIGAVGAALSRWERRLLRRRLERERVAGQGGSRSRLSSW